MFIRCDEEFIHCFTSARVERNGKERCFRKDGHQEKPFFLPDFTEHKAECTAFDKIIIVEVVTHANNARHLAPS